MNGITLDTILGKWAVILAANVYTVDCSGNYVFLFLGGYKSKTKGAGRTGKGSEKCLSELGCCDCSRTDL